MSVVEAARRLLEDGSRRQVVSVYLDLDPERFATAPARASQVHSLIDGALRDLEADRTLEHEDRVAARDDLTRVRDYLLSREPPFKGARGLAVFCSGRDGLLEAVQLPRPVHARVAVDRKPYVEPMLEASATRRWFVLLISRRAARLLEGEPDRLEQTLHLEENVHGQHDQGGWSQANYQRSVEKDVDDHIRRVAQLVEQRCRRRPPDRIALGGPEETLPRLEAMLGDAACGRIVPGRLALDVSSATVAEIREALHAVAEEDDRRSEREALDRLAAGLGSGAGATGGTEPTLDALNRRSVATLLLEPGFDPRGSRCPRCGQLSLSEGNCPADGSPLEELEHLREAVAEAALLQNAEVLTIRHHPDLGPHRGIGALLRY